MPKTLNVDKLERKFAAVTKSKESIQNLSWWIICHKSFHRDIVEEWLKALERGDVSHRLTLFYVANDVLQHCKKKDAPEYRASFAEVLERGVLLVKDELIRDEIIRMIKIWSERSVYASAFLKRLESTIREHASSSNETSDDFEEITNSEIIANFKPEEFILCLKQLSQLQQEITIKHDFLEAMDDLEIPELDTLGMREHYEGRHMTRKLDTVAQSTEDCIKITEKEITLRKKVLKLIDHSKVFYYAQNEEVRRVVHAYRIFGKKLKNMKKSLNEKKDTLFDISPVSSLKATSPFLSDNEASVSSTHSALVVKSASDESFPLAVEDSSENKVSPNIEEINKSSSSTVEISDTTVEKMDEEVHTAVTQQTVIADSENRLDKRLSLLDATMGKMNDESDTPITQQTMVADSGNRLDKRLSLLDATMGKMHDESDTPITQQTMVADSGNRLDKRLSLLDATMGKMHDESDKAVTQQTIVADSGNRLNKRLNKRLSLSDATMGKMHDDSDTAVTQQTIVSDSGNRLNKRLNKRLSLSDATMGKMHDDSDKAVTQQTIIADSGNKLDKRLSLLAATMGKMHDESDTAVNRQTTAADSRNRLNKRLNKKLSPLDATIEKMHDEIDTAGTQQTIAADSGNRLNKRLSPLEATMGKMHDESDTVVTQQTIVADSGNRLDKRLSFLDTIMGKMHENSKIAVTQQTTVADSRNRLDKRLSFLDTIMGKMHEESDTAVTQQTIVADPGNTLDKILSFLGTTMAKMHEESDTAVTQQTIVADSENSLDKRLSLFAQSQNDFKESPDSSLTSQDQESKITEEKEKLEESKMEVDIIECESSDTAKRKSPNNGDNINVESTIIEEYEKECIDKSNDIVSVLSHETDTLMDIDSSVEVMEKNPTNIEDNHGAPKMTSSTLFDLCDIPAVPLPNDAITSIKSVQENSENNNNTEETTNAAVETMDISILGDTDVCKVQTPEDTVPPNQIYSNENSAESDKIDSKQNDNKKTTSNPMQSSVPILSDVSNKKNDSENPKLLESMMMLNNFISKPETSKNNQRGNMFLRNLSPLQQDVLCKLPTMPLSSIFQILSHSLKSSVSGTSTVSKANRELLTSCNLLLDRQQKNKVSLDLKNNDCGNKLFESSRTVSEPSVSAICTATGDSNKNSLNLGSDKTCLGVSSVHLSNTRGSGFEHPPQPSNHASKVTTKTSNLEVMDMDLDSDEDENRNT